MTTKKKQVNIRLQPNVYEKLKIIASNDKRAVTNLVEYWVEQEIFKYETEYGKISPVINQQHNLLANATINMLEA